MNNNKIFRRTAVERLSSPENLDQVMNVVKPKNWAAIICLFIVVAAAVVWACFGEIARLAEGKGVLLSDDPGTVKTVLAVLSADDGSDIHPGMEAQIILDSSTGTTLTGKVVSVSAVNGKMLTSEGISIPEESIPGWEAMPGDILIRIKLDSSEVEKAAGFFSSVESQRIGNSNGWFCETQITKESYHPIRLILPE